MNIAGYKINPIRLIPILAVLLLLIWGIKHFAFPSAPKAKTPPAVTLTAFSLKGFNTAKDGWTGSYISQYGETTPKVPEDFLGANWSQAVGQVMHLEVYPIPQGAADPSYFFQAGAYTVMPAVFIDPEQQTDITQLQGGVPPSSNNFILLAFPKTEAPTPGQPISVTAMLWGISALLQSNVPGATISPTPAPVFVVDDGYQPLQAEQLAAPATQTIPLDIHYQEAGEEVDIQRAEYAAGQELRLLVTVTNLGTANIGAWAGLSASTASLAGSASVTGQATGDLQQAGTLQAQQSVTGYISFPASVANPTEPVTVRMPPLGNNQGPNDLIILTLQPKS